MIWLTNPEYQNQVEPDEVSAIRFEQDPQNNSGTLFFRLRKGIHSDWVDTAHLVFGSFHIHSPQAEINDQEIEFRFNVSSLNDAEKVRTFLTAITAEGQNAHLTGEINEAEHALSAVEQVLGAAASGSNIPPSAGLH